MSTVEGGARHWIDKNLMTIIATGLALYTGYLTGTNETNNRLDNAEREIERLEKRIEQLEGLHPRG